MNRSKWRLAARGRSAGRSAGVIALAVTMCALAFGPGSRSANRTPPGREEVVFWHFWGGADREVVEGVVAMFNASQDEYFVRAVAMPGNNLDLKLFLATTGGDPPDVVNQDDPIVADWAHRGALTALDELASPEELAKLRAWLSPAARELGEYDGRMFALCNGLDIRALFYNQTLLDEHGLPPPRTLDDLDRIADELSESDERGRQTRIGFLPDPRRLWAWGSAFGGDFYDEAAGRATLTDDRIIDALDWMVSYRNRFGAKTVSAFRQGDQSLPGKTFPLLAGRYAVVMDGQWRVRDIRAFQSARQARGEPPVEFGVAPLPAPAGGRERAGWVNGNFFVVPRGARCSSGAWAFMKYWVGFGGREESAAETCAAGGWIPVSPLVIETETFQSHLESNRLFAAFVDLSTSPDQKPTPVIPGAPYFQRAVEAAAEEAMYVESAPQSRELLRKAEHDIQRRLDEGASRTRTKVDAG